MTGAGAYTEDTPVTVTAAANAGYEFAYWTDGEKAEAEEEPYDDEEEEEEEDGEEEEEEEEEYENDILSSSAEYTFNAAADRALVAVFVPASPVTVENGAGGGYYAENRTVTVTADEAPAGYAFQGWTSRDVILADPASPVTSFTMPAAPVTITALTAGRGFGEADFVLPGDLTRIEAEAFEGDELIAVYVPDGCAFIGDHAFRGCAYLRKIRIPAECELGEGVFDGVKTVLVYGWPGSSAETYCQNHSNCVFVDLTPIQE